MLYFYCYAKCCYAEYLNHRYQKSLNILLKVCYVPATSAVKITLFSSFLLRPLTVLIKQRRQPVCAVKQSINLDVYDLNVVTTVTVMKNIALRVVLKTLNHGSTLWIHS